MPGPARAPLFANVLCAVDGTRASTAAVRMAACLAGPEGSLTLLAVTAAAGSGVHADGGDRPRPRLARAGPRPADRRSRRFAGDPGRRPGPPAREGDPARRIDLLALARRRPRVRRTRSARRLVGHAAALHDTDAVRARIVQTAAPGPAADGGERRPRGVGRDRLDGRLPGARPGRADHPRARPRPRVADAPPPHPGAGQVALAAALERLVDRAGAPRRRDPLGGQEHQGDDFGDWESPPRRLHAFNSVSRRVTHDSCSVLALPPAH